MIRNRLLFVVLLLFFTCLRLGIDSMSAEAPPHSSIGGERKILGINEDEAWLDDEPEDPASSVEEEELQSATCESQFDKTIGIVLFTSGVLYCFVGLAIICEGEFKDSVVEIAAFFKLPPDVAGATLMAAGTSSPELFTSLVALAGPVADIGTGTVVGSAIFNLLIIIGGCALFSPMVFHLNWKPVLRDTIVNFLCFIFLYAVFFDHYVYWYEAFLGCFFYVCYVAMMGLNTYIMNGMEKLSKAALSVFPCLAIMKTPVKDEDPSNVDQLENFLEKGELNFDEDQDFELATVDGRSEIGGHSETAPKRRDSMHDEETVNSVPYEKHEHFPTSVIGWIWFVLAWPYELVFSYTIPPVKGKFKYQFFATFFLSLCWLGVFSTFMVKWTEKIGCILAIEDAIMGVTFLAIGTSMPDCLTSIFVARTGAGNMAVCNALGSNVFDILLALSLPWAISTVINGAPVAVSAPSLTSDVVILTSTLGVIFFSLCLNRWRLDKKLGVLYYVLYILFVIYIVVSEIWF